MANSYRGVWWNMVFYSILFLCSWSGICYLSYY